MNHEERNREDKLHREDPNKLLYDDHSNTTEQVVLRGRYLTVSPDRLESNLRTAIQTLKEKYSVRRSAAVIAVGLIYGWVISEEVEPLSLRDDPKLRLQSWRWNRLHDWLEVIDCQKPEGVEWEHAVEIMNKWHPDLATYAMRTTGSVSGLVDLIHQVNLVLLTEAPDLHVRRIELRIENPDLRTRLKERYELSDTESAIVAALMVQARDHRYTKETNADTRLEEWCISNGYAFESENDKFRLAASLSKFPRDVVTLVLDECSLGEVNTPSLIKFVEKLEKISYVAQYQLKPW